MLTQKLQINFQMKKANLAILLMLVVVGSCWEMAEEEIDQVEHCAQYESTGVNCTRCENAYYLVKVDNQCLACDQKISNCTICQNNNQVSVQCYACRDDLFPDPSFKECKDCGNVIEHCDVCEPTVVPDRTRCMNCSADYTLSDDQLKCQSSSSASTIIIVSAIVGGVVLIGAGFAIFKCMKKKSSKGTRLLTDQD